MRLWAQELRAFCAKLKASGSQLAGHLHISAPFSSAAIGSLTACRRNQAYRAGEEACAGRAACRLPPQEGPAAPHAQGIAGTQATLHDSLLHPSTSLIGCVICMCRMQGLASMVALSSLTWNCCWSQMCSRRSRSLSQVQSRAPPGKLCLVPVSSRLQRCPGAKQVHH